MVKPKTEVHFFTLLLRKIQEERGLDFTQYRPNCLKRRIDTRLRANQVSSYLEYMTLLNKSPAEYELLLNAMTINVTEFFRDASVWDTLKNNLFPHIIQKQKVVKNGVIRVWSAGTSGGEEAYSLSILFHELLKNRLNDYRIAVVGTDIDKGSLKRAALGKYGQESVKGVDPVLLSTYFRPAGNLYAITDSVRLLTEFKSHNMITDPPIKNIQLITCRNAMIYFSRELQLKVLQNFYNSLEPGGYLVLGKSESLWGGMAQLFEMWNGTERIYKKKPAS